MLVPFVDLHSNKNRVLDRSSNKMKSHILLLVKRVFVPFANDDALSLKRYNQQVSGTLDFKSASNFLPSF